MNSNNENNWQHLLSIYLNVDRKYSKYFLNTNTFNPLKNFMRLLVPITQTKNPRYRGHQANSQTFRSVGEMGLELEDWLKPALSHYTMKPFHSGSLNNSVYCAESNEMREWNLELAVWVQVKSGRQTGSMN